MAENTITSFFVALCLVCLWITATQLLNFLTESSQCYREATRVEDNDCATLKDCIHRAKFVVEDAKVSSYKALRLILLSAVFSVAGMQEGGYIAGAFPVKFDEYTAYAEFLRKPMLQKKHKVELLYNIMTAVEPEQNEANLSHYREELSLIGFIVDNQYVYPHNGDTEETKFLKFCGLPAKDFPKDFDNNIRESLNKYIRKKYPVTEIETLRFLASRSEEEKKELTLLAANYYTNGFRRDLIDSYIAYTGLNSDETSGYWLADPDNWIEPVLQMRRYSNGHDNTKVAKDPREAVLENEAVKRLCRDKIEKIPKYVRLKKLIELAANTAGTKLVVKYKTAEGEATTIASYRFRDLQDYQLIQQDGFYLRNGCLCLDPSSGMFITIDDALAFIPLDNVIGVKLPSGIVYP